MPSLRALAMLLAMVAACQAAEARSAFVQHRALRQATGGDVYGPLIHVLTDASSLQNVSGIWVGIGEQYDAAVWATEENTLPACGTGKNFTYKHWDETLPDSVALAPGPNGTEPGTGINGHVTSTSTWSDVTYDGKHLRYRRSSRPDEIACKRFVPYVDHRNGFVYASSISKAAWTQVNGTVERTDASCTMDEVEQAGCYPQADGSVHSVTVITYRCMGGACGGYSPAAQEKDSH